MINVGVFGASGYTGFETIKILRQHPQIKLIFATSESSAGGNMSDIYPVVWDVPLVSSKTAPLDKVEAVFCCLPHAASMPTVLRARQAGVRVIDLSADFRLTNTTTYEKWYGVPHTAPELLQEAAYGISEINRSQIRETNLLANPGCYPTSIILALYPLLKAGLLNPQQPIIADSKSGVSGAGRKASLKTHFVEVNENLSPYNIGQKHRHIAEVSDMVGRFKGNGDNIIFSPHLVPISRGMLSTIYVGLNDDQTSAQLQNRYQALYADQPFIRVLSDGQLATMAHTQNSNLCAISITVVTPRQLILCSSIDNLGKGAAGQAVQNFNIMFGIEETVGLI
ncbi:N-acetyl-gamma-glutamyl-phosphate reductase [Anaerolineales bacterium HSG25]|nr:N-acetyl-gamma-glutamyl-phosphate reductase [Anaerolineales bacterium HSG25]